MKNLAKEKTKLRFLNDYSLKPYIKNLEFKECITIIKLRLNMIETKCNFKGNYINNKLCEICQENIDTTEHLFECKKLNNINWQFKKEDIKLEEPSPKLAEFINKAILKRKEMGFQIRFSSTE